MLFRGIAQGDHDPRRLFGVFFLGVLLFVFPKFLGVPTASFLRWPDPHHPSLRFPAFLPLFFFSMPLRSSPDTSWRSLAHAMTLFLEPCRFLVAHAGMVAFDFSHVRRPRSSPFCFMTASFRARTYFSGQPLAAFLFPFCTTFFFFRFRHAQFPFSFSFLFPCTRRVCDAFFFFVFSVPSHPPPFRLIVFLLCPLLPFYAYP